MTDSKTISNTGSKEAKPRKTRKTSARKKAKGKGDEALTAATRKKNFNLWSTFRDGRSLSLTFFKRNGWLILLAMVAVIWLISQRYTNQSRMEEIKKLEKTLRKAQSQHLDAKAQYMSLIRESRMRELMKENGLELSYQEQPPYILSSDK